MVAPAKLSDAVLQAFKDSPGDLLQRNPTGGPALSGETMRLVGSDEALLSHVIDLARNGNRAQRVAIGIGLAKAASACSLAMPKLEQMIKQAIAAANVSELATAFVAGLTTLETFGQAVTDEETKRGAPIREGLLGTTGGSARAGAAGPGGPAADSGFLAFTVKGRTTTVRRGGTPPEMSVREEPADKGSEGTPTAPGLDPDDASVTARGLPLPSGSNQFAASVARDERPPSTLGLTFSGKDLSSTYGATVSPTRR